MTLIASSLEPIRAGAAPCKLLNEVTEVGVADRILAERGGLPALYYDGGRFQGTSDRETSGLGVACSQQFVDDSEGHDRIWKAGRNRTARLLRREFLSQQQPHRSNP
ncbi:hypothetical protein [Microvirga sp. P5_D2]